MSLETFLFALISLVSCGSEAAGDPVEKLFEWYAEAIGVPTVTENVSVGYFLHGGRSVRGLKAMRSFNKGDVVLDAPEDRVWWYQTQPETKHWPEDCRCFVTALERRKGPNARFAAYVSALPQEVDFYDYMPVYADSSLLQAFDGLPIVEQVIQGQSILEEVYQECKEYLPADASFEEFRWAWAISESRPWRSDDGSVHVPVADLANTGLYSQTNVYWASMDAQELTAWKKIKEGEEILFDYTVEGENDMLGNDYLFPKYGVVLGKNFVEHERDEDEPVCKRRPRWEGAQKGIAASFESFWKDYCKSAKPEL